MSRLEQRSRAPRAAAPKSPRASASVSIARRIRRMKREHNSELIEIRLDRGLHIRILQFRREPATIRPRARALGRATPTPPPAFEDWNCYAHPGPSSAIMRRRTKGRPIGGACVCSCRELRRVLRRKRLRNRREQLRHLHDRALEPAKRRRQRRGLAVAVGMEPEQTSRGDAGGRTADIRARARSTWRGH